MVWQAFASNYIPHCTTNARPTVEALMRLQPSDVLTQLDNLQIHHKTTAHHHKLNLHSIFDIVKSVLGRCVNLEVFQLVLESSPLEHTALVVGSVLRFAIKFELSEYGWLASMCTCRYTDTHFRGEWVPKSRHSLTALTRDSKREQILSWCLVWKVCPRFCSQSLVRFDTGCRAFAIRLIDTVKQRWSVACFANWLNCIRLYTHLSISRRWYWLGSGISHLYKFCTRRIPYGVCNTPGHTGREGRMHGTGHEPESNTETMHSIQRELFELVSSLHPCMYTNRPILSKRIHYDSTMAMIQ